MQNRIEKGRESHSQPFSMPFFRRGGLIPGAVAVNLSVQPLGDVMRYHAAQDGGGQCQEELIHAQPSFPRPYRRWRRKAL